MIIIEVKLVSAIDSKRSRLLGKTVISNDGTGTRKLGNYTGIFKRVPGGKEYHGKITGFNRAKFGCWHLILMVLATAGFLEELKK